MGSDAQAEAESLELFAKQPVLENVRLLFRNYATLRQRYRKTARRLGGGLTRAGE